MAAIRGAVLMSAIADFGCARRAELAYKTGIVGDVLDSSLARLIDEGRVYRFDGFYLIDDGSTGAEK